ncbi:MAG: neutral zinc metallopeptidase, partial [Novosphingobium sp.]|nr:neutral zinc metallopeptidase [Novosphingobium sp.]
MRLDEFDDSVNVEDQRGSSFGLGGTGGRIGCGGIVIALIGWLVFGINPVQMLGSMQGSDQGAQTSQIGQPSRAGGTTARESCNVNAYSHESCNALSSLNHTWQPLFEKAGIAYAAPKLVFYSQQGRSGCGAAESAMGPFYCPADQGIYIDTDFYDQMAQQLGAKGEFAREYVIAHEYGHHVQNLLGLSDKVRNLQESRPSQANALSVRLELQADCYAGVWAAKNGDRIDPGDIQSGLNAAH